MAREAQARYRRDLAVFALAALCTTPLVLQMVWMLATGRHDNAIAPWLQFALAAPVQFVAGARFYRGAWNALRNGAANMDVLVALGTTVAFVLSGRMLYGRKVTRTAFAAVLSFLGLVGLLSLITADGSPTAARSSWC